MKPTRKINLSPMRNPKSTRHIYLPLFLFFSIASLQSQLRPSEEAKVDSIFSQWQNNRVPGVVAGLIYDTKEYTKAFGFADVENDKANTVQSQFQIGYVSRQFVVFGILQLENQGKLSLKDPIQKYLPDFPEYQHKLTISHLVNHSSGLNDYTVISRIVGVENNDSQTQEDVLNLIRSQIEPNFIPGTDFSHMTSKTEIALMLEVIKRASGQSLEKFIHEHVFAPLNMTNSRFLEDFNTILPNKAISYQNQGDTLKLQKIKANNVFYTTADDMLKWYAALTGKTSPKVASTIQKLDKAVTLTNGEEFDSWWGKLTLGRSFYHTERGLPAYWQFGRIGGYATNVFRFPEQKLTSFVLGNNNVYNGMPAMLHANHYIEDKYTEPGSIDPELLDTKKVSAKKLKKYEGHYWDAKRGIARKFEMEGDTLFYKRIDQEEGAPVVALAEEDTFQLIIEGDEKIVFYFKEVNGSKAYDITLGESSPSTFVSYIPMENNTENFKEHLGSYYNNELRVIYDFKIDGEQMVAKGPKGRTVTFYPVMKDTYGSSSIEFGSIRFDRDNKGAVAGFSIFTDGIQNLKFTKMKVQ